MRAITQYLNQQGYSVVSDGYYSQIAKWFQWYKGKVFSFHNYKQYNGIKQINRTRKSLGMAKKVCEDWANLGLNEKVEIIVSDERINTLLQEVLQKNNFRVRGNQLLELSFALGTGAFIEYLDGETIGIDYIRAGMIYPLRWENGEITACAFASERVEGKQKKIYLNIHEPNEKGFYMITNKMFIRNGENLTKEELPEGVAEKYQTGSRIPWFQIIQPNIVNNLDPDCPMGISVFANAIDQLEGLDLVYDSYCNEFRLGKKRIIVPTSMARMMQEEGGMVQPAFDDNDTEFYSMNVGNDGAEQKIQEINMELRSEPHEQAIKTALNLLSSKCGLGNDHYLFERGNLKTATEVISEKSELFQNLKKHELLLEKALIDMTRVIIFIFGGGADVEVSINFDDSVIEDKGAERLQFLQEIRDGVRQKWEYRATFLGEDEKTAKTMIAENQTAEQLMGFGGE